MKLTIEQAYQVGDNWLGRLRKLQQAFDVEVNEARRARLAMAIMTMAIRLVKLSQNLTCKSIIMAKKTNFASGGVVTGQGDIAKIGEYIISPGFFKPHSGATPTGILNYDK
jgi:hypothetical protein